MKRICRCYCSITISILCFVLAIVLLRFQLTYDLALPTNTDLNLPFPVPGITFRQDWARVAYRIPINMSADDMTHEMLLLRTEYDPVLGYAAVTFIHGPILITIGLLAFLVSIKRWIRRWRNKTVALCGCGYSLTGNTSGVCPECGTKVGGNAEAA